MTTCNSRTLTTDEDAKGLVFKNASTAAHHPETLGGSQRKHCQLNSNNEMDTARDGCTGVEGKRPKAIS